MGLLQQAIRTYDCMTDQVGIVDADQQKEPLAPVGHIVTKAQIQITVDAEGDFISAEELDDKKVIIPVTELSFSRTNNKEPHPHPLCDQITYISELDLRKHRAYLNQLKEWETSSYGNKKLEAVYAYLKKGNILRNLEVSGILKADNKGKVKNEKSLIVWSVIGIGANSGPVYTDNKMFRSWEDYYENEFGQNGASDYDYLSGKYMENAKQHMKGVVALNGNAKIISSNDKVNFTYRGRFKEANEALSIGYVSSQKAHNALKWVIANYGVISGNRMFVAWNPEGHEVPSLVNPLLAQAMEKKRKPEAYRNELRNVVKGFKTKFPDNSRIIIAGFDAATSGRLAITYYNELIGSDFIERLEYWDNTCCWTGRNFGTYSPTLYNLIRYAYGTADTNGEAQRVEVDAKLLPEHMQRLLHCRIDQAMFPADLMLALVHKAGNLQIYKGKNRDQLLFTTCAAIKKYYKDQMKEEWNMALDPDCRNRSYQFGRLLAIMEGIERSALKGIDDRETNAIRMQSVFVRKPGYATATIMDKLKSAYYPRLNAGIRIYYDRLIGEIMEKISEFPIEEYNKSLDETYLLGYYLQKDALYTKKTDETDEEEKNEYIEK